MWPASWPPAGGCTVLWAQAHGPGGSESAPPHSTFCEGRQPRSARRSRPPYRGPERLLRQGTLPWARSGTCGSSGHGQLTSSWRWKSSPSRAFCASRASVSARCRRRASAWPCLRWSSCRGAEASGFWGPASHPHDSWQTLGPEGGQCHLRDQEGPPERTSLLAGRSLQPLHLLPAALPLSQEGWWPRPV